jgi:hypothetical protein
LLSFVLLAVVLWAVSDSSDIDVVMVLLGGDHRSQDMDHSDLAEKQANSLAIANVDVQPSSNWLPFPANPLQPVNSPFAVTVNQKPAEVLTRLDGRD